MEELQSLSKMKKIYSYEIYGFHWRFKMRKNFPLVANVIHQVRVINAILNLDTSLSWPQTLIAHEMSASSQPSIIYTILNLVAPSWALNPYE